MGELEEACSRVLEPYEERRNGWYALDLGIRQMSAIRDWAADTADRIEALAATRAEAARGDRS